MNLKYILETLKSISEKVDRFRLFEEEKSKSKSEVIFLYDPWRDEFEIRLRVYKYKEWHMISRKIIFEDLDTIGDQFVFENALRFFKEYLEAKLIIVERKQKYGV